MPNPYIQVTRTYFQQPFLSRQRSLLTSFILFFFVIVFLASGISKENEFLSIHLLPFFALFACWAIHVKNQFADSRASLIPEFRKIHGVVAIIAATVFCIFLPGLIAPFIGWQSLGFVSITTLLFGTILWAVLRSGVTFVLLIMVIWFSTHIEPIQDGIERIVWGNEPLQASIFVSVGTILSIAGIIRLLLLHEDMPEYQLNFQFRVDGRVKLSDLQWKKMEKWYSRGWRHWWVNKPIVNLIYNASHATDSHWSKIHRWNYSNFTGLLAFLLAIVINLVFSLMHFIAGTSIPLALHFFIATFISAFIAIGLVNGKRRFISNDLMMPVRKSSYLKQLGMSVATSQFLIWGMMVGVSIFCVFAMAEQPNPEFLVYGIAYSVMMQIWMFGLAVWLLSFSSIVNTFLIMYIAIFFTVTPMFALNIQMFSLWRSFILLFGGLFMCFGLLLTWRGYRRWLAADFD